MKNKKSYFSNKNCSICKKTAHLFRLIKDSKFFLCNRKRCDYISLVKVGIIPMENNFSKLAIGEK